MNTSAGLLFVGLGLALLWLAITGRLQAMLDALTGAVRAPVQAQPASVAPESPGSGVLLQQPFQTGTAGAIPGYNYGSQIYTPPLAQPPNVWDTRGVAA